MENKNLLYKRIRAKQRHQQVLIGVYLYTFENSLLDIKILVSNIKSTILKKQKNIGKAERTEKKQNFSAKSRRGGSSG